MTQHDDVPVPDRVTELSDAALDWINSTAARTVALKLIPFLLPILGGFCAWAQDAIGIDMSPTVAAVFVGSVVLGAASLALMWVLNHGAGAAKLGSALLELEKLYEAGRHELSVIEGAAGTLASPKQAEGRELYDSVPDFTDGAPEETGAQPDYAGD